MTVPSEIARGLYQQAEEWIRVGDPVGLGRELLEQALADSPGFVAAAVSSYALTGKLPPATLEALKNDGPALWALASGVRKLGQTGKKAATSDDVEALVRPLIDRAVALDVQEARFARAIARAATGDRAGRRRRPDRLRRARAESRAPGRGAGAARRDRGSARARAAIRSPRPSCWRASACSRTSPMRRCARWAARARASVPADRLVALGLVNEYADRLARGARLLRDGRGDRRHAGRRGARARGEPRRAAARRGAAQGGSPHARRGGGRAHRRRRVGAGPARGGRGRSRRTALGRTRRALELAVGNTTDGDQLGRGGARRATRRLADSLRADEDARRNRRHLSGLALVGAVSRRGRPLRAPALARPHASRARFAAGPRCSRTSRAPSDELRHDVLKHRAEPARAARRRERRRATRSSATMTEPRPTSVVVATIYDRLAQAARGHGVTLRAAGARAGVRRACTRDLARAELLLAASGRARRASSRRSTSACAVRTPTRSAGLLQLGPRTRLDAATLSAWIASVEASARQAGGGWTAPALSLADLAVDFPVEHDALAAIFMNLLRNAQAAVAGQDDGRVIVRIDRARDVTGRQEVSLALGDSAPAPLTLETIEARESGRGLAIVRDLVREWRGHLVVRAETAAVHQGGGGMLPAVTPRAAPLRRLRGRHRVPRPLQPLPRRRLRRSSRRPTSRARAPPPPARTACCWTWTSAARRRSGWSTNAGSCRPASTPERRRRLAETQGILILRQLRAAGVHAARGPVRRSRRRRARALTSSARWRR